MFFTTIGPIIVKTRFAQPTFLETVNVEPVISREFFQRLTTKALIAVYYDSQRHFILAL